MSWLGRSSYSFVPELVVELEHELVLREVLGQEHGQVGWQEDELEERLEPE